MEAVTLLGMIIAIGILVSSSRQLSSTEGSLQQAYLFAGLALTLFAVGTISIGRGMMAMAFDNSMEQSLLTLGSGLVAIPVLLIAFFGFSRRRKFQQSAVQFRNTRYPWM